MLLVTVSDSELTLEQLNFFPIVLFVAVITFYATENFFLQFFIDVELVFKFSDQFSVEIEPNIVLDLPLVRITFLLHVNYSES